MSGYLCCVWCLVPKKKKLKYDWVYKYKNNCCSWSSLKETCLEIGCKLYWVLQLCKRLGTTLAALAFEHVRAWVKTIAWQWKQHMKLSWGNLHTRLQSRKILHSKNAVLGILHCGSTEVLGQEWSQHANCSSGETCWKKWVSQLCTGKDAASVASMSPSHRLPLLVVNERK